MTSSGVTRRRRCPSPNEHHFAFSKAPSVVQLNGEGPFDITYINPSDDPQKAAKA
jgi:hypothetical protein